MAKKNRRSISIRKDTYDKLKAFCEASKMSMSQIAELLINQKLSQAEQAAKEPPSNG